LSIDRRPASELAARPLRVNRRRAAASAAEADPRIHSRIPHGVSILGGACLVLSVACHRGPASVEVRATFPDSVPLAGVTVTAFPYDPQHLLDSLAAAYPVPKPDFSSLEAELRAFRPPDIPADDPAVRVAAATRDSVRRLADSLRAAGRRAPGYAAAYARFRRLYARLTDRSSAQQRALGGALDSVRTLADRAGRAADSLRSWEAGAYESVDSAAALEVARSGREPVTSTTNAHGWARFALASGTWYLVLRIPDNKNPFVEHVWDVPVTVAGFAVRTVMIDGNARTKWRH
jgi:hypothetical protein